MLMMSRQAGPFGISPLNTAGTEAPYAYWPLGSGAGMSIADHKIFVTTGEHSVTQPIVPATGASTASTLKQGKTFGTQQG